MQIVFDYTDSGTGDSYALCRDPNGNIPGQIKAYQIRSEGNNRDTRRRRVPSHSLPMPVVEEFSRLTGVPVVSLMSKGTGPW